MPRGRGCRRSPPRGSILHPDPPQPAGAAAPWDRSRLPQSPRPCWSQSAVPPGSQSRTRTTSLCTTAGAEGAMDMLPSEVIKHIISYLDLRSQLRLSAVSVWWREVVSDCLRRRQDLEDVEWHYWSETELRALLPRMPGLRTFAVDCERLDLDIVSENCPRLEKLSLWPFRLDTDSLERLCWRCPGLWELRLPSRCTWDMLKLLLRRLPGLRSLSLNDVNVTAAVVALLPAGLEQLELDSCRLHSFERQLADRWPRLTKLRLTFTTGRLAALMAGCPRLQVLTADYIDAEGDLLEVLPALPLQHLVLFNCTNLTESGLVRCLGQLCHLQTLDITGVLDVTDRVLDVLAGVDTLKELILGGGEEDYPPSTVTFTMEALQRLVVTSRSLRSVRLAWLDDFFTTEKMKYFVVGLRKELSADRDVTLVVSPYMFEDLAKSGLASESRPLRVVNVSSPI